MSHPADIENCQPRIAAARREADALAAALAQARQIRVVLLVAVVVLLLGALTGFYRLGQHIQSKEYSDQLLHSAQSRLNKKSEFLMREAQGLVEKTSPVLADAFVGQVKKDLPRYLQSLQKERAVLLEDLEQRLSTRVTRHYDDLVARHEALLHKEFRELDNPVVQKNLVVNLQVAMQHVAKKYYVEELRQQVTRLYDTWDEFPPAPQPGPGEPPLEDQLIANLLQVLTHKLTHAEPVATP